MASIRIFALLFGFTIITAYTIPDEKYFEILKSIPKPKGARRCSIPVMKNHNFAVATYRASFSPPSACGKSWSLVTLSWSAYLNASWYYKSSGNIFIDGINILKTSAQIYGLDPQPNDDGPTAAGAYWSFEIDLTKYGAYIKKTRLLTVNFPRLAGVGTNSFYFKANLTLNYYMGSTPSRFANVILPLSPKSKPNSPFNITYTSKKGQVSLSGLPRNIYRAEIEIFQLQGGSDEQYWYTNQPNKQPSGFRETLVYIDGLLAGAIWPFPVHVGYYPFYWQLAQYTGTYVRPTYKIDVTPFVGLLVNGKSHVITVAIAGGLKGSFWEVSGAIHLWLDGKSKQTSGKLITRQIVNAVTPVVATLRKSARDINATTTATRASKIVGSVSTSFGTFTVTVGSTGRLFNNIRYLDIESKSMLYENVTHTVRGTNSVEMKFKNGSRLFHYSDIFSYPLKKIDTRYISGSDGIEQSSQIVSSTTQYGKNAPRVDTLSNTQSLGYNQFIRNTIGNFSQRFSYRSNFIGCLYKSVVTRDGSEPVLRGRSIC